MFKAELRKEYLKRRSELLSEFADRSSRKIADRFFATFELRRIRTVHIFVSIPKFNEVDTSLIIGRLWRDHPEIRTVAPKMRSGTGELEHIAFSSRTLMVENSWGISEPSIGDQVEPSDLDLVVVPLLCFDRSGYRTGYGKGLYDRFLAKCRPVCLKIGVNQFGPIDRIDDVAEHDIRLDACLTPEETYRF